jgi:hypothetical protein
MTNENAKGCGLSRSSEKVCKNLKQLWVWLKQPAEVYIWIVAGLSFVFLYFWDYKRLHSIYHALHLDELIKNLDVGEFKDVILVIATFFVPFVIVFFTELFLKGKIRNYFKQEVFNEKVMSIKLMFWAFVLGVSVFSFFSGMQEVICKLIAIFLLLVLIRIFYLAFNRMLQYSQGAFLVEITYLEEFKFSKWRRNKTRALKIPLLWRSIWSKNRNSSQEQVLSEIFIKHVDDAINYKYFLAAERLVFFYSLNVQNRDRNVLGYTMLPHIFRWVHIYADCSADHDLKLKVEMNGIKILDHICDLSLSEDQFGLDKPFAKYELRMNFLKQLGSYIEKSENAIKINQQNIERPLYESFFRLWCLKLFEVAPTFTPNADVLKKWQITSDNKQLTAPHKILEQFLEWAKDKIFRSEDIIVPFNEKLSYVVSYLFPTIDFDIFSAFLNLYYSYRMAQQFEDSILIKSAIQKITNFGDLRPKVASLLPSIGKEEQRAWLLKDCWDKKTKAIDETIQIIYDYFDPSDYLFLHCEENKFAQDEVYKKNLVLAQLYALKTVLEENKEIQVMCNEKSLLKANRESLLGLIDHLIKKYSVEN